MSSAYVRIMCINILLVEQQSVSNLMPEPGVGNLRSSSVSQHVVLHAFHTGVLTHFRAIRRLVVLHLCKYKHKLVTLVLYMNTKELKCRQNAFLNSGTTASCHLKHLMASKENKRWISLQDIFTFPETSYEKQKNWRKLNVKEKDGMKQVANWFIRLENVLASRYDITLPQLWALSFVHWHQ